MSYIFDALQKSVSEDIDLELPSASLATQLLEATERKTAAARASVALLEELPLSPEASLLANLRQSLDSALSNPATVEAPLSVDPVLSEPGIDQFSQFQSLKSLIPPQNRVVCITDKDSLAAEKFRFLGVRLRQLAQTRPLKRVLITSTIPQEGKSMVAANLACTLARRTHQRTLLLDGDLRRPSVARLFGLGKAAGLSEWLQGERSPMTSIYHLEEAGLWVLPAGNSPRNPLEAMQSGRLAGLMDQLTSWFDWVIIDSPPVLPLADTSVWTRMADGVMLVARQGTTEREQLKRGLDAIESSKLLGAILNCSATSAKSDYYYQLPAEP
ncbi:MAG TPA: CpsD/CapB family tyrosine-protein kinase [Terriglobales bacterium]|jgi:capsular exopolysaccharide synthesis family protein|nr:CpsD/CapB family tyrosine-protein kinase [Terriglobales bacterium]